MMNYQLFCEADVVAECSQSHSSTRYPVRYLAGSVSSLSEIQELLAPPEVTTVSAGLKLGLRTAHIELTAVRLYQQGNYLLGGYLIPHSQEVQWVQPVFQLAQRLHLEGLVQELMQQAAHSSYVSYLPRHSAQMLALALVDAPHTMSVAYTGTAPMRFLSH